MEKPERIAVRTLESEHAREQQEILGRIDFEILKDIFVEIARKSGVDGDINFIPKEQIVFDAQSSEYDTFDNTLHIKGLTLISTVSKTSDVFADVCHEETHSVATSSHNLEEEDGQIVEKANSGVSYLERVAGMYRADQYRWFNEGITDKIARAVFIEYLKRTTLFDKDRQQNVSGSDFVSGYPLAVLFVDEFCRRISRESGVPEDVVWNGLIRSYMNKEGIETEETKSLLSDFFSESFFRRLRETTYNHHVVDLLYVVSLFFDVYRDKVSYIAQVVLGNRP